MSMKIMQGDVLSKITENAIIVHGCNAQGVMGGGFALQVKQQYPEAFKMYKIGLESALLMKCDPLGTNMVAEVGNGLFIVNAITQDEYGTHKRQVDYEAIAQCFEKLQKTKLPIHYPMIGAGLAGGNWKIISTIIDETLQGCNHTLWVL